MQVLVYYPASGGDIVAALPIVNSILAASPSASITWVTKDRHLTLFNIYRLPVQPMAVSQLRHGCSRRFDVVIDLAGSLKGRWRLRHVKAERYIAPASYVDRHRGKGGRDRFHRSPYALPIHYPFGKRPEVVSMPAFAHITPRLAHFVATALGHEFVATSISEHVHPQYRWAAPLGEPRQVAVYCDSANATKVWPMANVEALATLLDARGIRTVTVVPPGTQSRIASINIPSTWPEHAQWIRCSNVVIGPDTGPIHLAASLGAPTLALFGPTPEQRCGVLGPRAFSLGGTTCVFAPSLRPCWHRIPTARLQHVRVSPVPFNRWLHCRSSQCLHDLTPAAVLSHVLKLLDMRE